eukprot:GSChrysophyteH2.ASY1.ANO1.1257.1 assembled CDS
MHHTYTHRRQYSSSCTRKSSTQDFHPTTSPSLSPSAAAEKESFYISTPIYYVNGEPHLGHAYTSVTADMVARYQRHLGRDVLFVTGTDEHGQKVQQSAVAAGIEPQAYADKVSRAFLDMTRAFGCEHSDFIRTTEGRHKQCVSKLWNVLQEKGYIYRGKYCGWYAVRDEAYYTSDELSPDGFAPTGADVKWVEEESYFFKLSSFTQPLLQHYGASSTGADAEAEAEGEAEAEAENEVMAFLLQKGGLHDLSISRASFDWGVPVPGEQGQGHVVYVWLDALANYLTAVGYAADTNHTDDNTMMRKYWPADVHVVGKDILRFHCIYWPAFLMAAGLPLPKKV